MNKLVCTVFIGILVATSPAAFAADLRSRTSAEVLGGDAGVVRALVDVVAEIVLENQPILSRDDVIVSWRRVGGISPQPFRVAIPAGCFVKAGDVFRVRDQSCGVGISFDGERLFADEFGARLVPPDPIVPPEPVRVRIRLELSLPAATAGTLLSTLGGAAVVVRVGAERGLSVPKGIESVSGVQPTPF